MKPFTKCSVNIHSLVAVLFFVTGSGFTVILHHCEMDNVTCCETMREGSSRTMGNEMPQQGSTVAQVSASCCENVVIGGLNTTPVLLEKQSQKDHKLDQVAVIVCSDVTVTHSVILSKHHLSSTETASPPSVEKYVLYSSLLI